MLIFLITLSRIQPNPYRIYFKQNQYVKEILDRKNLITLFRLSRGKLLFCFYFKQPPKLLDDNPRGEFLKIRSGELKNPASPLLRDGDCARCCGSAISGRLPGLVIKYLQFSAGAVKSISQHKINKPFSYQKKAHCGCNFKRRRHFQPTVCP